jgi:two-component system nitrogen regulation sensor histidine kinase NtrY
MKPADLAQVVREALVLQRDAHPEIDYAITLPPVAPVVSCDRRLLNQALTNLLQNAADSIAMRAQAARAAGMVAEGTLGHIGIRLEPRDDGVALAIEDDGLGLPAGEDRERLAEPYVTHKPKGTGLGLAIVKKIMEDHGGRLVLEDRGAESGARAVLVLPWRLSSERVADRPPSEAAAERERTVSGAHGA